MARTALLGYQRETVRRTEAFNGRALIAHDPGLGKTICVLSWLARNRDIALPCLVVCPAAVKTGWRHEAITHAGRRVFICETTEPPDEQGFSPGAEIYVINYDILRYWVSWFRKIGLQTIVFDECQALANRKSKRTRAARTLSRGIPHVLMTSGTPLLNRPVELWPALNILYPEQFGGFTEFAHEFCKPEKKQWGWVFNGAENLDVLHQRLTETCLIRYRKADVLKDLPPKTRHIIPMELDETSRKEYNHANSEFLIWLTQIDPGKAMSAARAPAMAKVGYLLRLIAKLKMRSVVRWANTFLRDYPDEKIVLFAYHREAIRVLQKWVKAKSVIISGSVTGRKREASREQFMKDRATRVSINQLQAGGVGLNGYTVACHMAFCETWWRPGDFRQAADRLHRIGQFRPVTENWLIVPNTIEERLCEVLQQKQGTLSAVLDGDPLRERLDVFDKLLASYRGIGFGLL